jgi:hypothetical protein
VAFGGNHGHPVRGESRGEMRLREHGELYRNPVTMQSKRIEQLLSFCKRTKRCTTTDRSSTTRQTAIFLCQIADDYHAKCCPKDP